MIAAHRRRHRRVFVALALVLPLLLWLALLSRPRSAENPALPPGVTAAPADDGTPSR